MSERYNRQLLIKHWNQEKIKQSTVSLVGLGALGSVAAASLAMAGVGTLILIDMDTIELSNLNRQLFYRAGDIGKPKVKVSAQIIQELNSEVNVIELFMPIEKAPRHVLEASNVILDGLDTFQTRRWVNSFTVGANIPLISGGMFSFLGNLQVVIPQKTPCLECQSLIPEEKLQKACTPFGDMRKENQSDEDNDEYIPYVSSVSFVIGGLMAQEALKILLELPPLENYLFWDGEAGIFTPVPLERREDCIVCSPRYQLQAIPIRSPTDQQISDFMTQLRYSFNLSSEMALLHQTQKITLSEEKVGDILESGAIFRIVDPTLSAPLKFVINLD
ncbi:MAG: ThiF family adenylyltransferase [Candidatus Heimdallarchaeota archaeon]|nr:MAG: ThiF family adenylyltransferase [Candidatus Heimdallarchaeota archaeon]